MRLMPALAATALARVRRGPRLSPTAPSGRETTAWNTDRVATIAPASAAPPPSLATSSGTARKAAHWPSMKANVEV